MTIIPIFIPHAGCPHNCIFCNQITISGQKSAAFIGAKKQIASWCHRLRPSRNNEAAFYGGSFTALNRQLQEELFSLTDKLLLDGYIGSVRLSTRPDYIDKEELLLLRQHNVHLVELGVQSLDDEVLTFSGRGHTAKHVVIAMNLLKNAGFKTGIQLMVGLPRQNRHSVIDTAEQTVKLQPDLARIYPVLVLKNTVLANLYNQGLYTPLTLEEAVDQSSELYEILTSSGIKVIRIGLQPDTELCAPGNIIAGPFHPSIGELVKSRIYRNKLTPLIASYYKAGHTLLFIKCPPRIQSQVRGLRNNNMLYWKAIFPQLILKIIPDEVSSCPSVVLSPQ